ncbi:hypothetical protein QEN19_002028 [Hanseniaspora menglaensis]
MQTSPLPIKVTKDNFLLSKDTIASYPSIANTDRFTNLFINDYRIVGGCVPLNKAKDKVLMIQSSFGGNFIIPKGGIEQDELMYKKIEPNDIETLAKNKKFLKGFLDQNRLKIKTEEKGKHFFFNHENIPDVTYDFSQGALRETWEEAGVKGKVIKSLGTFYDTKDPVSYSDFVSWAKRVRGKFPKAIDTYYQVEVDEVSEEWPEKEKRKQKWLGLDDCVDHLLNNGRTAALKAVMNSDLVPDLQKFFLDRYEKDVKNFNKSSYIKTAYFKNKFFQMRSPTTNLAYEVVATVILNEKKDKLLIDKRDASMIPCDYVTINGAPFSWRCSRFFKKFSNLIAGDKKSLTLSSWLGELPCDYNYEKEFDESMYCFAEACYKINLTALEFSCSNDEAVLKILNAYNSDFYKWVTLDEWKNLNKVKGEYYKKLEYFIVKKSNIAGSENKPITKSSEIDLSTELEKLNL